jgi:predicted AlkP superfamily pyrophosphatase or phosphodiesterase
LPEALVNLGEALAAAKTPAYFFLYYDKVDSLGHEYGPDSPQVTAEIETLLQVLESQFMRLVAGRRPRTLFLLSADHGQVETDPATTIYINRDPAFAGIEKFLKADSQGRPIVPAGSCRDFFLYVREGSVDEARDFLAARLEGKAEVRTVAQLAGEGYFGPQVSPLFRSRAGDLVILPYRYESVWWYEKDHFEQRFYGNHGGLTRLEMEIPLITCDISK